MENEEEAKRKRALPLSVCQRLVDPWAETRVTNELSSRNTAVREVKAHGLVIAAGEALRQPIDGAKQLPVKLSCGNCEIW